MGLFFLIFSISHIYAKSGTKNQNHWLFGRIMRNLTYLEKNTGYDHSVVSCQLPICSTDTLILCVAVVYNSRRLKFGGCLLFIFYNQRLSLDDVGTSLVWWWIHDCGPFYWNPWHWINESESRYRILFYCHRLFDFFLSGVLVSVPPHFWKGATKHFLKKCRKTLLEKCGKTALFQKCCLKGFCGTFPKVLLISFVKQVKLIFL